MSVEHLTPEAVAGWREGKLAPRDRLRTVRHLGECASCRELVIAPDGTDRLEAAFQNGEDHPQYHDFEALADGQADPVARDLLLSHLAGCASCAGEYSDLAAFRSEIGAAKTAKLRPNRWALPAAVAALAVIAIFVVRTSNQAETRPAESGVVQTASLRTSLRDAGTTIGIDSTGVFRGLEGVPAEDRRLMRDVLQSGKLPVSADAARLKRTKEVRLGGSPEPVQALTALAPMGTVVPERNPRFHWDASGDARNFVVSVYTMDFELVAKSGVLTTNAWTPEQPLAEGSTYVWTVSAEIDGKTVTVPWAPEPEALFRVATAAERERLTAAKTAAPDCFLLEAAVASRLGMVDIARHALAKLQAANPRSPVVASLSRQLLQL